MYEKREHFDFNVNGTAVRLVINFFLDETKSKIIFRSVCAQLNREQPERNNNCEMSLGEITHLASIFLYESIAEFLNEEKLMLPPLEAFEHEETGIFEIQIKIQSDLGEWKYDPASTFCNLILSASAEDVFNALASGLFGNHVRMTMKKASPILVWPSLIHEFMHHADHLSILRENKILEKYCKKTNKSIETHMKEGNPVIMSFRLFSDIQIEALPTFCKQYEKNRLSFGRKKDVIASKRAFIGFAESLSLRAYYAACDNIYLAAHHIAMTIALSQEKLTGPKISAISRYTNDIKIITIDDVVKNFLNNDDEFFIKLTKNSYAKTKKILLTSKNFFELLEVYEKSGDILRIPKDSRLLSCGEYQNIKKNVREKTLQGKKIEGFFRRTIRRLWKR